MGTSSEKRTISVEIASSVCTYSKLCSIRIEDYITHEEAQSTLLAKLRGVSLLNAAEFRRFLLRFGSELDEPIATAVAHVYCKAAAHAQLLHLNIQAPSAKQLERKAIEIWDNLQSAKRKPSTNIYNVICSSSPDYKIHVPGYQSICAKYIGVLCPSKSYTFATVRQKCQVRTATH